MTTPRLQALSRRSAVPQTDGPQPPVGGAAKPIGPQPPVGGAAKPPGPPSPDGGAAKPSSPPPPPKLDRFPTSVALTLVSEGGNDDDPRDPGGRTSRGITQNEWNNWRASPRACPQTYGRRLKNKSK